MPALPAARVGDMTVCPASDGPKPHGGGPITGPPVPPPVGVIIGGMPAATVTMMTQCVGPPGVIAKGSMTVKINGKFAARVGDVAGHGGKILPPGCLTVLIGD